VLKSISAALVLKGRPRALLRWIHLTLSLALGVPLLAITLSGAAIVFRLEIEDAVNETPGGARGWRRAGSTSPKPAGARAKRGRREI